MSEELMAAIWKDCNGHAAVAVQRAISSDDQHFTEMYPVVTSQKSLSNFHEVKGKTVFCTFLFVCCNGHTHTVCILVDLLGAGLLGDLFESEDSLGHCVSEDLSKSKGIAVAFKEQFKGVDELRAQNVSSGGT